MKNLLKIAGYAWACACLVVVLVMFTGSDYLSDKLASATGITVSPRYSGGEVIRSIDHGTYKTILHRPSSMD